MTELEKTLREHNILMRNSLITIIQKRDSFGWDEECCALLAEETLRKIG